MNARPTICAPVTMIWATNFACGQTTILNTQVSDSDSIVIQRQRQRQITQLITSKSCAILETLRSLHSTPHPDKKWLRASTQIRFDFSIWISPTVVSVVIAIGHTPVYIYVLSPDLFRTISKTAGENYMKTLRLKKTHRSMHLCVYGKLSMINTS